MNQYSYKSREDYLQSQIERSQLKFSLCKVFFEDIFRYRDLIKLDRGRTNGEEKAEPILCLGVRSGAELDMFRAAFYSPFMNLKWIREIVKRIDHSRLGEQKKKLARLFGMGAGKILDEKVIGVEINPDAKRADVFIGSFDTLPSSWTSRFKVLYSNSFDHSSDPKKTVLEWKRVAAPGAYLILAFTPDSQSTRTDPLGGLSLSRLIEMWSSSVVFASESINRGGAVEICFRIDK